jgi:hypothetical protein
MRGTFHHSGLCSPRRPVVGVSQRLIAVTLIIGFATFAAVLPAASGSAATSTSVRNTPLDALLAKLKDPAATAGDSFGYSVAVSGTTAVVGASDAFTDRESNAGEAYIYVKGTSGWPTKPTATLKDPAATVGDDMFGSSVAMSGTTAVVGAPGTNKGAGVAYIYVKGSSGWPKSPTIELSDPAATRADAFGTSVAVSGKTVVVGAWGTNSYRGAAYIYVEGTSGWPTTPTTTLTDPKASADDEFGYSVAVSGTTTVVGASGTSPGGAAYIYVKGMSGWPTTPTTKLFDPAARANDSFGWSVAISGKTTVVGDDDGGKSRAGVAYIYVKGTSGWPTTPTTTLTSPAAIPVSLGYSVAVSGKTAVVGAPGTSSSAGATYIYRA